jgi:hypothetical protein
MISFLRLEFSYIACCTHSLGSLYGVYLEELTWDTARQACLEHMGDLASMETEGEWQHIYSELKERDGFNSHWLGANKERNQEGFEGFHWMTGGCAISKNHSAWFSAPDDGKCLDAYTTISYEIEINWRNVDCLLQIRPLCEFSNAIKTNNSCVAEENVAERNVTDVTNANVTKTKTICTCTKANATNSINATVATNATNTANVANTTNAENNTITTNAPKATNTTISKNTTNTTNTIYATKATHGANSTKTNVIDANATDANATGANATDVNITCTCTEVNVTEPNGIKINGTEATVTETFGTETAVIETNGTEATVTEATVTEATVSEAYHIANSWLQNIINML